MYIQHTWNTSKEESNWKVEGQGAFAKRLQRVEDVLMVVLGFPVTVICHWV